MREASLRMVYQASIMHPLTPHFKSYLFVSCILSPNTDIRAEAVALVRRGTNEVLRALRAVWCHTSVGGI